MGFCFILFGIIVVCLSSDPLQSEMHMKSCSDFIRIPANRRIPARFYAFRLLWGCRLYPALFFIAFIKGYSVLNSISHLQRKANNFY